MRIIIADDNRMFRNLIRQTLERYDEYEIVDEAVDGLETLEMLDLISADLLLLDIEMPGMSGIDVIRELKKNKKDVHILLISSYLDPYLIEEVLRLGADGYLAKEDAVNELTEAVSSVWKKDGSEAYLSRTVRNEYNNPMIF